MTQRYQTHKRLNSSVCVCLPDSFTKTLCSTCLHNQHSPNVYVYVFQPQPPPAYSPALSRFLPNLYSCQPSSRSSLQSPSRIYRATQRVVCLWWAASAATVFQARLHRGSGRGCPRCFCSSAALGWRPRLPSRGQITVVTTSWRQLNSQGLLRVGGGPSGRQTPRRSAANKPTSGLRSGAVPGD